MLKKFILLLTITFPLIPMAQNPNSKDVNKILELTIDSSINPATHSYLKHGFKKAEKESFDMLLIKLNTPGGLVTTTKDILTLIGESNLPVVIWITPEGASATSAGAIIASSAHLLFMSEGTNMGAATPITMGKDIPKDARAKAINDLVALTQSLSESRGRNAKLFGEMVSQASSFKAQEAAKKKLTNGVVNTQIELFKSMDQQNVNLHGKNLKLHVKSPQVVKLEMDAGQMILNIFANPSMAYILFLIGAALLYFELQAPGGFIAGSIGAICLLLAGIGFQVLPLNLGALGLIILSFVLFVLEAYITSYGLLTLAGLASLLFGSLFLYRTETSYMEFKTSLVYSAVAGVAIFLGFIVFFLIRDVKQHHEKSFFELEGHQGTVSELVEERNGRYFYKIKTHGEIWGAWSEEKLGPGDQVVIGEKEPEQMSYRIKKVEA